MTAPGKLAAALADMNAKLGIEAAITITGDEVKCHVPDDEGGTEKRYLSADDCMSLAAAFRTLAKAMVKS